MVVQQAQQQLECNDCSHIPSPENQRSIFVSQDASDDNQLSLIADIPDEAGNLQVKLARKRGGKRHRSHWMKRPMAVSEVIVELQDSQLRENALRCLSAHLIERREQDLEFYRNAGFFIYNSFGTMSILIQEILSVYPKLASEDLSIRGSKRLANVLTLLQSVASNEETRGLLVKAHIPNYLIPFILSQHTEEIYENVRIIALSVIGIICQGREEEVMCWAMETQLVHVCVHAMQLGSELSKVIAMYILEALLQDECTLSSICDPKCGTLMNIIEMCTNMVKVLAAVQDFSPRLLFHIIRCFILLSQDPRALDLLREKLPIEIQNTTFLELAKEFPMLGQLQHQLLLNIGKVRYLNPCQFAKQNNPFEDKKDKNATMNNHSNILELEDSLEDITPLRLIDFNKQDWASITRLPKCQATFKAQEMPIYLPCA